MTFRYIGSKSRLADEIITHVGAPSDAGRFVDLFCGTGAVAAIAASRGWNVHLNDHLRSSVIAAAARLVGPNAVPFRLLGSYERAVDQLNAAEPRKGFIYREYSPASVDLIGFERRYFTTGNASKIDAARAQIQEWREQESITSTEETLLLADLLSAANRVANIAGTYGCFMSKWQAKATTSMALRPRRLADFDAQVGVSVTDAGHVPISSLDTVYLDPPYTKRQYAAYYHLLETIVLGDKPKVSGVAGLRPWQTNSSAFCYKTRALDAIISLVSEIPARRIYLSYSDNAHIPIDALANALSKIGDSKALRLKDIGRYRPNRTATMGRSHVSEFLFRMEPVALEVAA